MSYILIVVFMSIGMQNRAMTSQQIEFKTKDDCTKALKELYNHDLVAATYCLERK